MRALALALVTVMLTAANQTRAETQAGAPLQVMPLEVISPSSQYDVPPKFIGGPAPTYPDTPRKFGAPGYAMISFTVDDTGRTHDFRLWETNYMFFYTNGVAAIQKWRIQPATKHGRPVACRVRITFRYRSRFLRSSSEARIHWPERL
jgi:TonB family protein